MNRFIRQLERWFACAGARTEPPTCNDADPAHAPLCPLPTPLALRGDLRVLVFAPHPDDEILGCGGTLALLARLGCPIRVVIVTDGAGAGGLPEGAATVRKEESRRGLKMIGIEDVVFLDEPDGAFRATAAFDETIRALLSSFRPDTILMPSPLDYHRDHVALGLALLRLWQAEHGHGHASTALLYEVWAPLPANRIVDISDVLALKQAALAQHRTALEQMDYASTNQGLAHFRGLYLGKGTAPKHAEAFLELRQDAASHRMVALLSELRGLVVEGTGN